MKAKFDELIARVKPLFKDNGFTKNGLNFYKNTPEFIYVVNFQKSSGNTAFKTRFYVNCGIYGAFIDFATGKETVSKPKEYECHFRERISSIRPPTMKSMKIPTRQRFAKIYQAI